MQYNKTNDKTIRLRYIRVLEKFITRTITLLKKEDFNLDLYKTAVEKNYAEMKKSASIELFNEYPVALKNLAQTIMDTLENHSNDFEDEKQYILKQSNLLHKLKNNSRYKKDKHKKKKFTDGY
ncbi:MAG: hypothetical protein U9Q04_00855 [Campylobacterota bacterium]|nr:hypothetical protein [Campylobacterota bacterium]